MTKCPICKTASEQEKQEYCLVCAWEFEYFFSELSSEEKERYDKKITIHQALYDKVIEPKEPKKSNKYLVGSLIGLVLLSAGLGWKLMEKENKLIEITTTQSVAESQIHSTKGITTVDGLMYQNQFITKEDDKNYYENKLLGRVQTWQGSKEYCQGLTLGGYKKWRLPNRVELRKLITKTTHKTASGDDRYMRADFAKNLQSGSSFWTSESKDSSDAWYVDFDFGDDFWYYKTVRNYALCVR